MRTLVCTEPGLLEYTEKSYPAYAEGNTTFQFMAHGARYVLVGLQKEEIHFSHPEFHKREATLMSSRNATREDFEFVIESIMNKKINPLTFISHRASYENLATVFPSFINPESRVIKAMVEM